MYFRAIYSASKKYERLFLSISVTLLRFSQSRYMYLNDKIDLLKDIIRFHITFNFKFGLTLPSLIRQIRRPGINTFRRPCDNVDLDVKIF